MSALARLLARLLWAQMLWTMRRPWIKRARRNSVRLFPGALRGWVWASIKRQDWFARRYGLRVLTAVLNLFLWSIMLTAAVMLTLTLYESGALTAPAR